MTAITPTSPSTSPTRAASARTARRLPPALHYTLHSTALTARVFTFVLFTVALPMLMYVVLSRTYGAADYGDGLNWAAILMVSMAAYGSLGAAMSGGAQLAVERRSGWFRQLSLTALPPRSFLWARAAVIMLLVLPALLLVFAAGFVIGGVRAPMSAWIVSLGLMWLGLVPLAMAGIVVGVWVKAEAVQGVTTLVLLVLAMLGGLWFPVQIMPAAMQQMAHTLPSFWLADLGRYPFIPGAGFPWQGVAVDLAWVAGLTVLGMLGYRRAAASSKR